MEEQQRSYYAIIPANVRYDKDLAPNAKLLYGEITALCNEKGYCWASNQYFAELYGVSVLSVKRWVNSLVTKGYVYRTLTSPQFRSVTTLVSKTIPHLVSKTIRIIIQVLIIHLIIQIYIMEKRNKSQKQLILLLQSIQKTKICKMHCMTL